MISRIGLGSLRVPDSSYRITIRSATNPIIIEMMIVRVLPIKHLCSGICKNRLDLPFSALFSFNYVL